MTPMGLLGARRLGWSAVERCDRAGTGELDAFVHEDLWCVQRACHLGRDVQLDGLGCPDIAIETTAFHDENANVDFGLNIRPITKHQHVASTDFSAKGAVDAESTFEIQLAFEMGATSEQGCDLRDRNRCIHDDDRSSWRRFRQAPLATESVRVSGLDRRKGPLGAGSGAVLARVWIRHEAMFLSTGWCLSADPRKPATGLARSGEPCSNGGMKSLARISAIGMVGLSLGTVAPALGEQGRNVSVGGPLNVGPAQPTTTTTLAESSREAAVPAASGAVQPSPNATVASKPTDERKSVGGGYSWSNKQRRSAHRVTRSEPIDPKRPLAQAPNFELRSDGSSVVTLMLSMPTEVTRTKVGRRVEYQLKNVQTGVWNNSNPLVTAHFATPLVRVILRRGKRAATLQLELREDVQPTHQLRAGPGGSQVLEITLPKPTRNYVVPAVKPSGKSDDKRDNTAPSTRRERRKAKRVSPGPGPKL